MPLYPPFPAATSAVAGIAILDGTAGDITALGTQAAGSTGKGADAAHVHPATQVNNLELAAGTTSLAPLTFQSGTNLTTAAAGDAEFDGTAFYLSSSSGNASAGTAIAYSTAGAGVTTGTAATGTRFGSVADIQFKASGVPATVETFALTAVLPTLMAGTAYWFDIALLTAAAADSAELKNVAMTFVELS